MREVRADRLLADAGAGTRSEVKKIIKAGRFLRNGVPVTRPETKIRPDEDELTLDGRPFSCAEFEYWVLNKPQGVISATEDRRHETVISYMGLKRKDMAPCGRLDIDTEGLLLVTDDGALVHRLLAPGRHVPKVYEVTYDGTLPPDSAERMKAGLVLEDGTKCLPAELESAGNPARLVLHEGKFHQVKRMFASLGCPVTALTRLSMGPLSLEGLKLGPGEFRKLTEEEVRMLTAYSSGTKGKVPVITDYDAVIFDLDGTLIDSMWVWKDIDVRFLNDRGIEYPEDLPKLISGLSFHETAVWFKEHFSLPESIEEILHIWEEMTVETYRTRIGLKPGAEEFLRKLAELKMPLGIATSNGGRLVDAVLEAHGIRDIFRAVITSEKVQAGKPKPDVYFVAAAELGVAPERCLVFEDIPEGIQAGLNAGMQVCAVRDDFSAFEEEEKQKLAGWMISDYREIL